MKYEIIETPSALKILIQEYSKIDLARVVETEAYSVFQFKNGGGVLIPFNSVDSIALEDVDDWVELANTDIIEKIRSKPPLEYDKLRIKEIDTTWVDYLVEFSRVLNRNIDITDDVNYLKKLNMDILKYGKKKAKENLYVHIGVYLCLVIKMVVSGEWRIKEKFANTIFNYFEPIIVDAEGVEYQCWKKIAESFNETRRVDILDFLKFSSHKINIDITGSNVQKLNVPA